MRRFVFLAALVTIAACGNPQAEVGESSVKFASQPPADSALNRAADELTRLGFTVGGRHENLIFTTPQPLPAAARPATANDTTPQLWFLHVTADRPEAFRELRRVAEELHRASTRR